MPFRPEETDLARLASDLVEMFGGDPPKGYLPGKTALRDAVAYRLTCSQLEAEQIVDTMMASGFLRYEGAPASEVDDWRPWAIQRTLDSPS